MMLGFNYNIQHAITVDASVAATLQEAQNEFSRAIESADARYESGYDFVRLCYDREMIITIKQLAQKKKALQPAAIVFIGIGGSNLGPEALVEALYSNKSATRPVAVYFVDTFDSVYLSFVLQQLQLLHETNKSVLVYTVSKSGSTAETMLNFKIVRTFLERYYDSGHMVVATTYHSALWKLAQEKNIDCLTIPNEISGRYSVFSAVGLFLCELLDISIDEVVRGAQAMIANGTQPEWHNNRAATSALILFHGYKKGLIIHNMFFFNKSLEVMGKWYRQLMAESLGKKNRNGNATGIVPLVSIGTTDLHSMYQLYLAGPKNIMTTFITIDSTITNGTKNNDLTELDTALNTAIHLTIKTYDETQLPFIHIAIPELTPYYCGQFIMLHMMTMVYLGALLHVNPFDQPDIENIKSINLHRQN
jgi:glucose-6-phosphate isomerase